MKRLQYFGACVATSFVIGCILAGGFWIMKPLFGSGQGIGAGAMLLMLVGIALLPGFWVSFSIQAARVRDIGWDPRIFVTASIVINAAYLALLVIPEGTTADIISKLVKATNLGYGLTLLLLPSNFHVPDSPSFDPPRVSKPTGRVEIPAAPRPQGRGGATFGRRGL
ncbi:hypothetical protein ATY76_04195 [Rhizobium sp. R339]|nr:hypothetical protein ATY76_04195 [Rhizobium sp. R339]